MFYFSFLLGLDIGGLYLVLFRTRKEEGGRRKEEGGRRKEEGGRRKEEGGRRVELRRPN